MRVHERGDDRAGGGGVAAAPVVRIEVCRCGRSHPGRLHDEPEWPLATAWAWLTRPTETEQDAEQDAEAAGGGAADHLASGADGEVDPASLPWWDARSRPGRRRAVLPFVLLGELQAGVLLRALWEVLQRPPGPAA